MEKMKALVDMCRSQNPSLQVRFAIFHPQLRYFRYKHIHSLASKVIWTHTHTRVPLPYFSFYLPLSSLVTAASCLCTHIKSLFLVINIYTLLLTFVSYLFCKLHWRRKSWKQPKNAESCWVTRHHRSENLWQGYYAFGSSSLCLDFAHWRTSYYTLSVTFTQS